MPIADIWWAHRARAGDRKAFDALYARHATRIFNLLRRLGASCSEAEDLSQETFVTAFRSLPSWREASAMSTWLCGIAVNTYRSYRRSQGREPLEEPLEETLLAPEDSDPLARLTTAESAERVQTAIIHLPDHCREAFVLVYVEHLSYKETAQLLGIPVGTVQSRLNRAKQLLHRSLSEYMATEPILPSPSSVKGENLHVL